MIQQLSLLDVHPNAKPLRTARIERDVNIERAADKADRIINGWQELAYAFLEQFARKRREFTSYELRMAFKAAQLESPPSDKAFGAVFVRAANRGLIKKNGFAQHPERHASPTVLWWSLIYPEAS